MKFLFSMAVVLSTALVNLQALDQDSFSQGNVESEFAYKNLFQHKEPAYIYLLRDTPLSIGNLESNPIQFEHTDVGPVNIKQNAKKSEFTLHAGIYEIAWSLNLQNPNGDIITFTIYDENDQPYGTQTIVYAPATSFPNGSGVNASNFLLVKLSETRTLSLAMACRFATAANPTVYNLCNLSINRIH